MEARRRRKAIIASIVFPGVGQFMTGQILKGAIVQVVFIALLFGMVLGRPDLLPAGLIAPAVVWLYGVLDLVWRS